MFRITDKVVINEALDYIISLNQLLTLPFRIPHTVNLLLGAMEHIFTTADIPHFCCLEGIYLEHSLNDNIGAIASKLAVSKE